MKDANVAVPWWLSVGLALIVTPAVAFRHVLKAIMDIAALQLRFSCASVALHADGSGDKQAGSFGFRRNGTVKD